MRTITAEYDHRLAAMATHGMTLSEISEELDRSQDAIRRAARRRSVKIMHERDIAANPRLAIQNMKMSDAIEYLCDCVEQLQGVETQVSPMERWGFEITPVLARALACLEKHAPNYVTKDGIYSAIYFDRMPADLPRMGVVDVHLSRLRKLLPPGWSVPRNHGFGYRLVKPHTEAP